MSKNVCFYAIGTTAFMEIIGAYGGVKEKVKVVIQVI